MEEIFYLLVIILYLKKHSMCSYLELLVKTPLLFHTLCIIEELIYTLFLD